MGSPGQENWNGLLFPSPEYLPNPGKVRAWHVWRTDRRQCGWRTENPDHQGLKATGWRFQNISPSHSILLQNTHRTFFSKQLHWNIFDIQKLNIFKVDNLMLDTCIYCKKITTIKLINIHYLYLVTIFFMCIHGHTFWNMNGCLWVCWGGDTAWFCGH